MSEKELARMTECLTFAVTVGELMSVGYYVHLASNIEFGWMEVLPLLLEAEERCSMSAIHEPVSNGCAEIQSLGSAAGLFVYCTLLYSVHVREYQKVRMAGCGLDMPDLRSLAVAAGYYYSPGGVDRIVLEQD